MMTKAKPFFEVFPSLELKGTLHDKLEQTAVERVSATKQKDRLSVYLFSTRLLPKEDIWAAEKAIKSQLFPHAFLTVRIFERFELSAQYTPENLMEAYRESILAELKEYSHVEYNAFRTEPNLQNIPIRMELGRLIRKVFVPKEGYVFLDADYSQIELRVLAHMSGDEKLIQAYKEAQDIHRITASQVFHIPFEQVTDLQRRNAKAVNFGIVYGISSFGLSQDLSITRKEAAAYIQSYFETYPQLKGFLDRLVEQGKTQGYVATMFGQRRPVPELKSSNHMQRSFGERVAMNSPIQGSAADIIKIAMNRVRRRLSEEGLRSKLILQVHDELLVETHKDEVEAVFRILEEEMKGAAQLAVSLEVDMHQGENWYEAK